MRTALGLAIAVACALAPSSASAGIAYVHYAFGQTTIEYHAKAGERNTVDAHWQLDGRWVDIYDNSATITTEQTNVTLPGIPDPDVSPSQEEFRPCVLVNEHHAHCMLSTPPENSDYWQGWAQPPYALRIELGDRDDSFGPSWGTDPYWAFVYGDEGNDSITLGRGLDGGHSSWGYGGPGDDSLTAPDGATAILFGEDGNDRLEADNEAQDGVFCGAGEDYAHVDGSPDDDPRDCETVVRGSLSG